MNAAAIAVFFAPLTTVPCFLWTQMARENESDEEEEDVQFAPEREGLAVPAVVLPRGGSESGSGTNVTIVTDRPRRVTS